VYVGRTLKDFAGQIHPVSWDAALVLRDLGVEFFLLIVSDNPLCNRLENTLLSFLQHQKLFLYAVKVSIDDHASAARQLGATYVPQVRYYQGGKEIGRHRGVASYETLSELINLTS